MKNITPRDLFIVAWLINKSPAYCNAIGAAQEASELADEVMRLRPKETDSGK